MLMFTNLPSPLTPSAEQGFTLIELLVTMLVSFVVIGALFTILQFTTNQEKFISDKVQADQIGRTAMTNIIDELHSSCTGVTPIQAPKGMPASPLLSSGPLNLWFISAYGDSESGENSLTSVVEHDINWTETKVSNGKKLGTLTDYEFKSESTSKYPEWKFPAPNISDATATKVLAKNVIPPEINGEPTIFQYYQYENGKLTVIPATLTEATAEEVAKVTIDFTQAPSDEDIQLSRTASFSDSAVLRLDPITTSSEGPCE
jgi:type II secretory pathway pseudopilin PulG